MGRRGSATEGTYRSLRLISRWWVEGSKEKKEGRLQISYKNNNQSKNDLGVDARWLGYQVVLSMLFFLIEIALANF